MSKVTVVRRLNAHGRVRGMAVFRVLIAALVIAGMAQEVAGVLGMKTEGAEALLGELEKKGAITDVSFKSDKVKKYTKAKGAEEGR